MHVLATQDINWWTGVMPVTCGLLCCFNQLFGVSIWRHPFTAEDPLMSEWCYVKHLQICSDDRLSRFFFNCNVKCFQNEHICCWFKHFEWMPLKKWDFQNTIKYANKSYPLHFSIKFVKFVLNYIIQMDGNMQFKYIILKCRPFLNEQLHYWTLDTHIKPFFD